jgi:8-oxo-dGTP pyrophosphatase MutT (NUDIX family)
MLKYKKLDYNIMTGSSILPVGIYKGKLFFLFGKENEFEKSAKGFSDFGGGNEKGETMYDTAMREGAEELTGFLGDSKLLREYIQEKGGVYHINYKDQYHVHVFLIDYDEKLPMYYNQNHRFLWEKMDKTELQKTKLFEKIEIKWFSVEDIKKNKKEFRPFYRDIITEIIKEIPKIKTFIDLQNTNNKTKKKPLFSKHVHFQYPSKKSRKINRMVTPFYSKKNQKTRKTRKIRINT